MIVAIFIGLIDLVISYGYAYASHFFGYETIQSGSNQVSFDIPAMYEEILVRFTPFGLVPVFEMAHS